MTPRSPTTPAIRPVGSSHAARAAGILAGAFADDPVSRWMIPRDARLQPGFEFYFRRIWLPAQAVYETEDGRAIACWMPPGKAHMSLVEQLRLMPGLIRAAGRDLPRLLSATAAMEKDHPHEDHWYLNMLGVVPAAHGRGLGSALLAHTLERCDAEGMPAYLDATTERSRALYERHGFEVTGEFRLPKGGPPLWRMWREPRQLR